MARMLKVAIDAQIHPSPTTGGVESVLFGLLRALGQLEGPEDYTVIGPAEGSEWLRPYLGRNQRLVPGHSQDVEERNFPVWRRMALRAGRALKHGLSSGPTWPALPISDGFHEALGCDVIHFPCHTFTLCALPTLFNPHDLQHRHFPAFFSPEELATRESLLGGACRVAHAVAVSSDWIKEDVVTELQVDRNKVQVIPWAPPTTVSSAPTDDLMRRVREKHPLPEDFCLYPAVTWPHKNHLRLLEAVRLLKAEGGVSINLICTGGQMEPTFSTLQNRTAELGLEDQVRFLGFVPQAELRALYRLARFTVVPTLFEAASGPVFEAWQDLCPVACSNVTSLPQQVLQAALLFDPYSIEEIAHAIRRMTEDAALRARLVAAGTERLKDFSWDRTARAYRALYRKLAHATLGEEDRQLLDWDWMSRPVKAPNDLLGSIR